MGRFLLLIAAILAVTPAWAVEEEFFADLVVEDSGPRIDGLAWDSETYRVTRTAFGQGDRSFVTLRGTFPKDGWTLSTERAIIDLKKGGKFRLEVPMTDKITFVNLMAIGPLGEVETQKVGLYFPEVTYFQRDAKRRPVKRYFFSTGLGLTTIVFKDSRVADFAETAVTGKLTFLTPIFPPRWDAGATVYVTLLPLTASNGKQARFLGINARIGYVLPSINDPWKLTLLTGVYYTTMFVSPNNFGFKNLSGPQLFPLLSRTLKNHDALVGYLKFSPIGGSFRILSLSNHEKAVGFSYVRPMPRGRSLSATLDVASLSIKIQKVQLVSNSITLGVGYGL